MKQIEPLVVVLATSNANIDILFLRGTILLEYVYISHIFQVYPTFQKLGAYINTQFQRQIKTIQYNNGGEYVNSNL